MPDLNLKLIGRPELWIELKAGSQHFDLRPAQFAWIRRRTACGGVVVGLNRFKAPGENMAAWHLHDLRHALFEPKGQHVRVISAPLHVGFSIEHLDRCLFTL